MSDFMQCFVVALVLLLLAFSGCETLPTMRELELRRGNCHECVDEETGEIGWCCERPINEELVCYETSR
jgi:hypothetical protein